MKSALELAMEKANQAVGGEEKVKLTDEQKTAIDEVRKQYEAKWAEQEIALKGQLEKVSAEDPQTLAEAQTQVQAEMNKVRERLLAERETKIEVIRNQ